MANNISPRWMRECITAVLIVIVFSAGLQFVDSQLRADTSSAFNYRSVVAVILFVTLLALLLSYIALRREQTMHAAIGRAATEWRVTFDAVEEPIVMLDVSGKIRRLNRSARDLLGARRYEEVLNCAISDFAVRQPWAALEQLVANVALTKSAQAQRISDSATLRTWAIEASPAVEGSTVVIARDITELIRLQDSLRRAETTAALGALVAGVAHEVRNPLFSISATLDTFELSVGDCEEYREYTCLLRREVDRLRELMQDLLEYGKPPSANLTDGDVAAVIKRAVQSCKLLADKKQVRLNATTAGQLPIIPLDSSRILTLFINLLENAIYHSRSETEVVVEARLAQNAHEAEIECVVRDQGCGFGAEDLPYVFDPFFSRRRGGTGLGLSIAQRVVEEHGGTITATNADGGGAVITARLPVVHHGARAHGT